MAEVMAGDFEARFKKSDHAKAFYDRLVANPEGDYAEPGSVKLNRTGGRIVTWHAAPKAFADHGMMNGQPGIVQYWLDMCDTVGYYGSSFGEPPFGAGRYQATLNGRACTASM